MKQKKKAPGSVGHCVGASLSGSISKAGLRPKADYSGSISEVGR
ncbi:hypothetical protein [Brevibacillus borstelensis]